MSLHESPPLPPRQLLMLHGAGAPDWREEKKPTFWFPPVSALLHRVNKWARQACGSLVALWEIWFVMLWSTFRCCEKKKVGLCTDWLAPRLGPQAPPLGLMGERHRMLVCVCPITSRLFLPQILMEVLARRWPRTARIRERSEDSSVICRHVVHYLQRRPDSLDVCFPSDLIPVEHFSQRGSLQFDMVCIFYLLST